MDFIFNGQATGDVADRLLQCNGDIGVLRPFIGDDGRSYITNTVDGVERVVPLIGNATATLRHEEWKIFDDIVVKVAKPRLKAVSDIRSRGLTYGIPNGMSKTVLSTETQSDIGPASVSMDGIRENANDRPVYELSNLPLPIIHKDFSFSLRQLLTSRNGGSPLDTTMAELSARRVAEEAEKMLIGNSTTADQYNYGGGIIYGYTDFPNRITRTITAPTAVGWTGATFLADVMAMKQDSQGAYHYGPWVLYVASAWDQYLDDDYKAASDKTIRSRVKEIEGLQDIITLDYLTGFDIILVQMTSDVVREVVGMDIMTVQWDTIGGLMKNFKIMAILVPQLRADQNDNTGIVHGSV